MVVVFHCFKSFAEEKNSATASVTSTLTTFQQAVKNSALYPSGPLHLFLEKEKKADLISSFEKFNLRADAWLTE